jgi:hypothetical protein
MTSRILRGFGTTLVTVAAFTAPARAVPRKCQQAIAKESSKFVQARAQALQKCEDQKVKAKLPATTDCTTEPETASAIQKATDKLASNVAKQCGGADKSCSSGSDDEPLGSIGWGGTSACPDFESSGCTNAIGHCGDIAECLLCIGEAAVDQGLDLYYGQLDDGEFGEKSALNKCQRAIGKETTKFLQAKSKALQKCWDARLKTKHSNECPDPGDGKARRDRVRHDLPGRDRAGSDVVVWRRGHDARGADRLRRLRHRFQGRLPGSPRRAGVCDLPGRVQPGR